MTDGLPSTSDFFSFYEPTDDEILMQLNYAGPYPFQFKSDEPTIATTRPTAITHLPVRTQSHHDDDTFSGNQLQDFPYNGLQLAPTCPLSYYGGPISQQWSDEFPLGNASHVTEGPVIDSLDHGFTSTASETAQFSSGQEQGSSYGVEINEGQLTQCHEPCTSSEGSIMDPYGTKSLLLPDFEIYGARVYHSHGLEQPVFNEDRAQYPAFPGSDQGNVLDTSQLQPRKKGSSILTPLKRQLGKRKPRTQRRGPLSSVAREKADSMRMTGACWRCRRYRKPCNEAIVCDNCLTSGFRVWPSEVGCYRGTFLDLAMPLMPDNAETAFQSMPPYTKQPNWRRVQMSIPKDHDYASGSASEQLVWKVLGTRMLGRDFIDFFKIVSSYQASRKIKSPLLEAACLHLSATTDFYHAFISTDAWFPTPDLITTLQKYRASSHQLWRLHLKVGLSGRRNEWFSLFLSSIVVLFSVVICTDAAFAMPASTRNFIWHDLQQMAIELRGRLYTAGIDLLGILAQHSKPLSQPCWEVHSVTSADGTVTKVRNEAGLKLMNGDETAFDGIVAFKRWMDVYGGDVEKHGKIWFSNKPFTMEEVRPIGVLYKIVYQ